VTPSRRSYYPGIDDPLIEPILMRPQEMPRYVEAGILEAGICGRDWILENGADLVEVASFVYAKQSAAPVRWVIAVPERSAIERVEDLAGKRISTELVNVTRKFLTARGVEAEVEFSWGATEAKVPRFADAIVELTETGSSLRANNLRVMDTVLESVTVMVANRAAWDDPAKRQKLQTMAMMAQGAMLGREKVGLKMNVPRASLEHVLGCLKALRRPTVSPLSESEWVAIETVMNECDVRTLIPELKAAGAEGIIEYPLNKVIL
jgi:ATP phosphoribosyltransferase